MTMTQTTDTGTTVPVEANEVEYGIVLIYLLLDESASMTGERIQRINDDLPKFHEFLRTHPAISDHAHL